MGASGEGGWAVVKARTTPGDPASIIYLPLWTHLSNHLIGNSLWLNDLLNNSVPSQVRAVCFTGHRVRPLFAWHLRKIAEDPEQARASSD